MTMPGYIDLQVNGYAGVDFNAPDLTPDALHHACQCLQDDGVAAILATIITAELPEMISRLEHLARLRSQDPLARQLICGIHLEGPFINPQAGFVGAHPADAVLPADTSVMQQLLDAADGLIRLVTLAPECDAGLRVTRQLANQGIAVSAGHTDASRETLQAAIDAGLRLFTHLGNGCPAVLPRHDNIVQRVLSLADQLSIMLIADGIHLPFFALQNYLHLAGLERALVVTDAISAARMGPGRYTIGHVEAHVGDDGIPRPYPGADHFAGSALTMPQAATHLQTALQLSAPQIDQLLVTNPRRALGMADR